MAEYSIKADVDVTETGIYTVNANSVEEAIEKINAGEYQDIEAVDYDNFGEIFNVEVVEVRE